jgi:hypothetical protein
MLFRYLQNHITYCMEFMNVQIKCTKDFVKREGIL